MAVEACVKPKLIADDSDDDEPLVFRRTKPNPLSSESKNSSTLRPDKQPGKPRSTDIRIPNDRSSSAGKGKEVQSSKPSSSKPPIGTQKSLPPVSRPQKSPPSSTRPSPSPPPSRASPLKSPSVNGASSTNHQTKKDNTISVKEDRRIPVKGEKHLRDEPEDSEDDMPLSSRLSVRSNNGNSNMVDREGKHLNGDSGDSDDDKPLSARLSSGLAKANSSLPERGRVAGEPSETQKLKTVGVKSPNDSEKPLLSRLPVKSSAGTSSRKYGDSADGKHVAHQNGYIKRENETKNVPLNSAKRPSDASSGQSSIKKAKLSDASTSGKAKQIKEEQKDDDDHIPIAQRMSKASLGSKPMPVKKTVAKVDSSKLKKVDKKSKKIMKKSNYSKSSKELPNSGDGQKWTTLVHNGVIFPPPYKPHGVKMLYDGKPVDLTPEQEEVATMYAVMLETDYVKKEKFNENFFNDWKKLLGKNHLIKELKKCDFRPIYEWHLKEKEKKKQMSSEEKKALKEEKLKQEEKYMWAIVDGVKEKVGNFRVEPPGLFRGRGEHPKMGKLKKRIYPSDITINVGKDAPIPECPIPGQRWKEVRHDNTVTWLAYWNDPINPKEFKYVFLAASSTLKGQSDKEKYEKARKLKEYIQGIRAAYRRDFTSKDMTKRQIAVATYLIDRLALRAGNEKDDDEADTVGCCTLKVENVKPIPPNILEVR